MSPRVVVADDQPLMRAAFTTILSADAITVVAEAGDGAEAIRAVTQHHPDVVLMDVRMPRVDGIAATEAIRAAAPGVRVLILTTFDDDVVLDSALRAGAAGFLLKNSTPEELVAAVRRVAAGDCVLDPAVTGRVLARAVSRTAPVETDERIERLTERERDVLLLLARGRSNAEVADALGVGEATAKTHVSRVLTKLGVRDRVQAVIHAYDTGFALHDRPIRRSR